MERWTPESVLFDLDGTLLDTAPDMLRALCQLCRERGQPEPHLATLRPTVSHGSPGMLPAALGVALGDAEYAECEQRFLQLYRAALALDTALFPGMAAVLEHLETRAIPWGIVTNKPSWLTAPLLQELQLHTRAACVVSGDTLDKCKPEPEPLWYACAHIGVAAQRSLYVGDAERDIQAGKRAGMVTLVAGFGYLSATDTPYMWGADGVLEHAHELLRWL